MLLSGGVLKHKRGLSGWGNNNASHNNNNSASVANHVYFSSSSLFFFTAVYIISNLSHIHEIYYVILPGRRFLDIVWKWEALKTNLECDGTNRLFLFKGC